MSDPSNIRCPVCGYYCLGKGGVGCVDKLSLVRKDKTLPCKHKRLYKLYDEPLGPMCLACIYEEQEDIIRLKEKAERLRWYEEDWLSKDGFERAVIMADLRKRVETAEEVLQHLQEVAHDVTESACETETHSGKTDPDWVYVRATDIDALRVILEKDDE